METIISYLMGHIPDSLKNKYSPQKLELAFEELIINIYEHGYKKNHQPIFIRLHVNKDFTDIEFRDYADQFDLVSFTKTDLVIHDLDKAPIGGQGIKFIKGVIKHLSYRYERGMNITTLRLD
jgi:anti-sigma regulatory factor (Ser/Thr protein kinase)